MENQVHAEEHKPHWEKLKMKMQQQIVLMYRLSHNPNHLGTLQLSAFGTLSNKAEQISNFKQTSVPVIMNSDQLQVKNKSVLISN